MRFENHRQFLKFWIDCDIATKNGDGVDVLMQDIKRYGGCTSIIYTVFKYRNEIYSIHIKYHLDGLDESQFPVEAKRMVAVERLVVDYIQK